MGYFLTFFALNDMNRYLFILLYSLLVFLPCPVFGQEQKVWINSFTHDPMDMGAKDHQKRDGNGNLYALVKVRPASKDFRFSFGYLSCVNDGTHGDETWLYVQKSARTISVTREGFTSIRNKDLGITLEAGETYILELSYVEPQNTVKKQWLKFDVLPNDLNAVVKVKPDGTNADYEIWGQTQNGSIARNLECGRYLFQVVADNYLPSEGVVTLNKPNETHTEKVTLTPNFGFLQIDDAYGIAGAQIYVNNKLIGTIPYKSTERWESGEYDLSITKGEMYKTYNSKFTITKGQTTVLKPRLESNAAETKLRVAADAQILIDQRAVGTREWSGPLKEGRYEVECRMDKHKSTFKTITIKADEAQDIVLDIPTPITGSLSVNSTPLDALITLDGKQAGTTPKTLTGILIGEHTVTLSHANHKTETRTVTINEDKETDLDIKLSNIGRVTIESSPAGAALYLNGERVGKTPYTSDIASGEYEVKVQAKRCRTYNKMMHIDSSQPILRIPLVRQYMQAYSFYIQPTFQAGSMMAAGGAIGGYIANVNIEAGYMQGLTKSEMIYWNSTTTNEKPTGYVYKSSSIEGKLGYGITLGTRMKLTPQIGVGINNITASERYNETASFDASKAYVVNAGLTLKYEIAIAKCLGVFVAPSYNMAVKKSGYFEAMEPVSSKIKGFGSGFNCRAGLSLFF